MYCNEKEQIPDIWGNTDQSHRQSVNETGHKRIHAVGHHLCEFKKQAELIDGDRS